MANDDKAIMLDIYERLGGIEAKLDNVNSIKKTADRAFEIANRAEQKANDAQEDLQSLTATMKWGIGICASGLITLGIFVLGNVLN